MEIALHPPWWYTASAVVESCWVLSLLTVPVNLVLLLTFLVRRRRPVAPAQHRLAGWAVYAYGVASTGFAVLFVPEAILEWRRWADLGEQTFLLAVFLGPSVLGLCTWIVQFRRAVRSIQRVEVLNVRAIS